ncbi:MAG: 4-(cytidine 5'-diphospho)-2-C-methyl-D-erythritol kinase [Candidatus Binatia bacterium]
MYLRAPAKINVFLRITGRRPDGYHLLDSLMVPVSLCDEVRIEARNMKGETWDSKEAITITCDDPTLPTNETNLAYKAAALLCREAKIQAHVTIDLRKRIPAGAGLGGGSSDAATVLKGVNSLLSLGFDEQRLCTVAARLGADVPFFIGCRAARVQGIGEILTPLPMLPPKWFVLVVPPFAVSTPWAYRRFDELPCQERPVGSGEMTNGQWPTVENIVNDLERVVIPAYPLIEELKQLLLQHGAESALMSGSGSAVFGMFTDRLVAERAVTPFEQLGKAFVVEHLSEFR